MRLWETRRTGSGEGQESEALSGWCKACEALSRILREMGRCAACGSRHVSLRRPETLRAGEAV